MRQVGLLLMPVALAIGIAGMSARSEEVMTVQLGAPIDNARRDAAERMLKYEYPRYRSLWESQRHKVESYVRHQAAGLRINMPCDGVSIRVALHDGEVVTATYAATVGECVAGQVVKGPEFNWNIPSPDQLFKWIADLGSPPSGTKLYGCLLASFDPATGIPTKIDAGCPTEVDGYFVVEVSDIRTAK